MAQYRGVFIAPPSVNKRTHRRSKTHPQKTEQYKSVLAHLPRWESFTSLCSQGAPSIPCLLKEVTLKFKQDSSQKRQTSNYELLCSVPKKLKGHLEPGKDSDSSETHPQGGIEKSPFESLSSPHTTGRSIADSNQSIYYQSPSESLHLHEPLAQKYLGSTDQGETDETDSYKRDSEQGSYRDVVPSDKGPATQEDRVVSPEDISANPSAEKRVLTFGKTVYPEGFYPNNTLPEKDRTNTDVGSDNETHREKEIENISLQENEYFASSISETSEFQNSSEQEFPNRISPTNKNQNLGQLLKQHQFSCLQDNSIERPRISDFERIQEPEKLEKSTRSSRAETEQLDLRRETSISENEVQQEETPVFVEVEKKEHFEKTNDEIAYEIKRKSNPSKTNSVITESHQNKGELYIVRAQQEPDTVQERVEELSVIPFKPTVTLENNREPDRKIDEDRYIVEEVRLHRVPIIKVTERAYVDNPNEVQEIKSPTTYKGPIVYHFETSNTPPTNKGLLEVNNCEEDSEGQIIIERNPGNVSPRCLFPSPLEDPEETLFPFSPKHTSTPKNKDQVAKERLLVEPLLAIEDLNSELVVEETSYDPREPDTMASLQGQNVKVNRELWESRETIRQLQDKLLKEQKNSESKERTMKSLKKEVKKMEDQLSEENNNHEDFDDLKSKLLSLQTDNRILVDQVRMVEEANRKLYKELYETKTQLRFQERRSDDVNTQNTHTGRRLSQVLQSAMDKNTGFTVFLHQLETNLISTESALRKLKAQRQALEDVLKEEEEDKPEVTTTFSFLPKKKENFLSEEVKVEIRSHFEKSLECEFTDAIDKELHCDERMEDLEDILNYCIESKCRDEKEKVSVNQKRIDLARVHVKALKDIEGKCMDIKKRTEDQIANMKGRISNEVKEISKEISAVYLAKQERKGKPRRKISSVESPQAIRKKSVDEIADIDRTIRSMKSKSRIRREELSENEKEILTLNEKMSQSLDDKIQLSEELLETELKIQELEKRYEDKQQETEKLEMELSMKRQEIAEMAKEMQKALSNISSESLMEIVNKQSSGEVPPKKSQEDEKTLKSVVVQREEKEVQINDMKEELVHTILLLETEQQERQEALRMNEDLFLELENREQEISNLVMELEQLQQNNKTGEDLPETWTRLNELVTSFEPNKTNEQLALLRNGIEEEVRAKEIEFCKLSSELNKQREESDKLVMLLNYYKDEMSKLQQEKQEQPCPTIEQPSLTEKAATSDLGADSGVTNENLPAVENVDNESTRRETIARKLENDVLELQNALAKELDFNHNSKENALDLEEALRKERQAKEYAYKRNRELEEELRVKDAKLKNFAFRSVVGKTKQEIPQQPAEETKPESPVTTIEDLRATMAQIQSEKEDLTTEVNDLANALEENGDSDVLDEKSGKQPEQVKSTLNIDIFEQTSTQVLQSEENALFDHVDGSIPKEEKADRDTNIKNVQQKQVDKTSERKVTEISAKKGKVVEELEQAIHTLKKEVEELRSENALLENEAVDVLDDGLKVENKILRNEVNSLTNELAIARADEDDMKREFEHVNSRSQELEGALANLDSVKNDLEYTNEDLVSQNKILNQELGFLRKKIEVLEEERKIITDQAIEANLDFVKNELEYTNKDLVSHNTILNQELDLLRKKIEVLEEEKKIITSEAIEANLHSVKNDFEYTNEDLVSQNAILKQELDLLRTKIELLEEERKIITGEVIETDVVDSKPFLQENENLITEIAKITLDLKVNKEEAEKLKDELATSEGTVKELEGKLSTLQKDKASLEILADDLSFQNQTQEKEMNLLKKKIGVLEEEIGIIEQELSQRSDEVKEKESAMQKLLDENATKENEKEKLENELKEKEATFVSSKIAEEKQLKHLVETNCDLEAQLNKFKMDATKSRQEQLKLEKDLNELRDRLREADRKFSSTRDDKVKTEDNVNILKSRVGKLEKDLSDTKIEIRAKNELIRKLKLKNSELEIALAEREEDQRREERLRMDNMKLLDALKIKMEKMEADETKQRDRLFNLKSACSEANEAYEIVKRQNLNLRNDMQDLKNQLNERNLENNSNKRDKEKLEEQILNASRTIDDIRKYTSARDESLSPDSALGISVSSLTDLGSGPNSPNSDASENLFTSGEDELKLMPQEQQGLLYKMPTMIDNFRAVVRDNELMKSKIVEMMNNKDKMNSQLQHYSILSDDLQKDVGDKERFLGELQTKTRMLEDELNNTKNSLGKVERDFAATASEADIIKTTLKVREYTVAELREKVELLEEKEKALELYSKSVSEKYKHEALQRKDVQSEKESLNDKNCKQKILLANLEKKLSAYSSRPRRVSEPELKSTVEEEVPKKTTSEVAMVTLEGKLDSIIKYSDVLESYLTEVELGYRNLQAENERLQKEMVKKDEYENLQANLKEQEKSFKQQEETLQEKITHLATQSVHLENHNLRKDETIDWMAQKEQEVLQEHQNLKDSFAPLEEANAILKDEIESVKEDAKQAEETRVKLEADLKLTKTKMCEMELTTEAYKEENDRLRNDVISLSEEKCDVECKVSEAERREKKLNDIIHQERAERDDLRAEHETVLTMRDSLQSDLTKAKEKINRLEAEQDKTQQASNEMETKLSDITSQKGDLGDELQLARNDLKDLEDRYKKAVYQEELLNQKLNKLGLENSRLMTASEQSQKRKNDVERELMEAKNKNEDYEAELEEIRIEKAGLLKEITQKEETIESMESKKSDLEHEKQKLTNDLYLSTKKVLSLQLNLESLRNDVTQLGKELRRFVLGAVGREVRDEAEEKSMEADLEMSLFENEVVVQALKQTIKATERNLDLIRPEVKISEVENKLCQKDIDSVHREFAFLKDQLSSFRHSCQKLSDEAKRLKDDLNIKEAILHDTREHFEAVKENNTENKENILQLQTKCNELEMLSTEYEQNAETAHNDMVRANQTIASLEANLAKMEQKKNSLEKERLVMQERLNNLEALQRATKDEVRTDKKRIASLEVEYNEKQGLARDLERVESNLNDFKLKYEDAFKAKEEMKAELATAQEELHQEELELKITKKDAENFKKHIVIEKEMRERVEQDLNEHVESLKSFKKNIHTLQRAHSKLQDDNETLNEKAKLLEEAGQTFKKQLEVQSVEMKRLRDSLKDTRNEVLNTSEKYEGTEKERKRLSEDLVYAEEQVKKLQDTCNELIREKGFATDKVGSLSDTLDVMISSHEDAINNLKQELMGTNKDMSVTKSALERSQNRNQSLEQEIKIQEDKNKAIDEKKQELFDKFWESQNELSEAQSCIDSLKAEAKDLKGRLALYLSKSEHLEDALQKEHEESEKTIGSLNERISALKNQGNGLFQERDMLQSTLQQTEDALDKTSEELKQTSKTLSDKEQLFVSELNQRDNSIDDLKNLSEEQRGELKKTKEALRDVCRENSILKEKLEVTEKTLDLLETKVSDHENHSVDTLAEAQAKLKVVSKFKASNSGENFVELQSAPLLEADPLEFFDRIDGPANSGRGTSIKDVVDAFHKTCMSSFGDNRDLQDKLAKANEDNTRLDESLNKERNNMAETQRYLQETEKKKAKLDEEVKRLRHRLEIFKQKSIEMERSKDDELCDLKAEKMMLDKGNWTLKEEVEELRVKAKETEEERDRYVGDLNTTQKQVIEAREDIKQAQEQIDGMQEQLFEMKKRTFELEAREKSLQQQNKEKEKELSANQVKTDELNKLYDNANQKKTELFSNISKAEEMIKNQETEQEENAIKNKEMHQEIETLKSKVSELQQNLQDVTMEGEEAKDKIDELEIQRGSLQASNEILKHQLEHSRSEKEALKNSSDSFHDESLNLFRALNEATTDKAKIETEIKCLTQEKERLQEALNASENQLRESEDDLVKAFQEGENLKRQMLKVQSTACAESVKLQGEFAKMKSELESTKTDVKDKEKDYNDKIIRLKVAEKEIESLKRELNGNHMRESELKLDYTSANSKLQSYVLERECWEREVKSVLGEFEQQKNANATKEHRLERLRMRYEQEIGFLSQRVSSLERELKIVQDASEQQRHADDIAHKLNLEAKDMEIDNLRMRLQATRMHTSDKNTVVDQMKNQLDERSSKIGDLMNQMSLLKDSYKLELASVQADLKCSQMENLLKLKNDMGPDNQLGIGQSDSVSDLLEAIKSSRKESERLRHLLGSRMREMNNLKKDIMSKRAHVNSPGSRPYGLYNE